jgi:ferric-dicitrate binding protein FerR (iron transport regulator)
MQLEKSDTNSNLTKWAEGALSPEETKRLSGKMDLRKLEKGLEKIRNYSYKKADVEKAWENLQKKIEENSKNESLKKSKSIPLYLKIAASILLAVIATFWLTYDSRKTISTEYAETRKIYLPDSSLVMLNAGSCIKYEEDNWKKERNIELTGEAYFEVKKGSTFSVNTELADLKVLGTSFNIKVRHSNYIAKCYTGFVEIYYTDTVFKLKSGEGIKINEEISDFSFTQQNADWINNKLVFDELNLTDVFDELKICFNFNVKFKINNIEEKRFSGQVPWDNIEESVLIIATAMNLEYDIDKQEKTVYFYSSE